MTELLRVERLEISFPGRAGPVPVVRNASFAVEVGQAVGLVGESGSGKSLTALALLGLVPAPGRVSGGRISFDGRDLSTLNGREWRRVRGGEIGLVFQEPASALNPVLTVGTQIAEAIRAHGDCSRAEAKGRARELLSRVALPDPDDRLHAYSHELSGGQRQRVMIAIALAGRPKLLIADEPTTALDVTIQAQILDLLQELRLELGLAVLLITHDLAVVAEECDRVAVMYAGEVVEQASVRDLFETPAHPYTEALLGALPRLGRTPGAGGGELVSIPGRIPEPAERPVGCVFHPRCQRAMDECRLAHPATYDVGASRTAACLLHRPKGDA